jgi:6-pyruvoyltetrahydropterin/6-carboxytetrahydropterin synthase
MQIFRDFEFESAHFLPHVPEGHKCRRMHGHGYRLRVVVEGTPDPRLGWIMDFGDLKSIVGETIARLDHRCLNEIAGLENPTAEAIAAWIWRDLAHRVPGLCRIELRETEHAGVIYAGGGSPSSRA